AAAVEDVGEEVGAGVARGDGAGRGGGGCCFTTQQGSIGCVGGIGGQSCCGCVAADVDAVRPVAYLRRRDRSGDLCERVIRALRGDGAVASVEAEDAGVADGVAQDADASSGGQGVLGAGEGLSGGEGDLAVGADLQAAVLGRVAASRGEQVEQAGVVDLPAEQSGLVAAICARHVEGLTGCGFCAIGCGSRGGFCGFCGLGAAYFGVDIGLQCCVGGLASGGFCGVG